MCGGGVGEPFTSGVAVMPPATPPPRPKCLPRGRHPRADSLALPTNLLAVFADLSLLPFVASGSLKASSG